MKTAQTLAAELQVAAEQLFVSPKGMVEIDGVEFDIRNGEDFAGAIPPNLTTRDAGDKVHPLTDDELLKPMLVSSYAETVAAYVAENGPLNDEVMDGPSLGGWKVGHTSQRQSDENMVRFAKYATID